MIKGVGDWFYYSAVAVWAVLMILRVHKYML
jgi:hypothetical protein